MSTIPWGEDPHVDEAAQQLAEAGIDPPESDAQRRVREAHMAHQGDLRKRMSRLYHLDPDLWHKLEAMTVPRPGDGHMAMRPPVPLDFATMSGYQMGQHSITTLFRRNAEEEAKRHG